MARRRRFLAAVKSKGRVHPHPNFEDGLELHARCARELRFACAERVGGNQELKRSHILRGGSCLKRDISLPAAPKLAA